MVAARAASNDFFASRPADQDGRKEASDDSPKQQGQRHGQQERLGGAQDPAAARRRCAWTKCGRSIIRPSSDSAPASGLAAKAATTARAWLNSASLGVKARLITATWSGWIAIIPLNPSRRARPAKAARPSRSRNAG